jgi:hypothetical protein
MKRFRLRTLMLLIVIAALCVALVVQHNRASQREAALQARLALSWPLYMKQEAYEEAVKLSIEARNQRVLQNAVKQKQTEDRPETQ